MSQDTSKSAVKKHPGSCHCGAVRFEIEVDASAGTRCNCTVCTKLGVVGAMVKPPAFALLSGEGSLSSYEWGGKVAKRFFCSTCGAHLFGRGHLEQLGGDFVSVNLNCLDDVEIGEVTITHWDGRHDNWQAGARPAPWPIFQTNTQTS
jgi:hypothetical protein